MRLLHTSDWHLGRSLHRESLLDAQAAWADWLVEVAIAEGVDAVLVAGDIFDRAIPPVDAVRLADDLLARLADRRIPVVLIPGNHDSATRLGFGGRVAAAGGVHLRTTVAGLATPVTVTDAGGGRAVVYGVPYLDPDATRLSLGCERSHAAVLGVALDRVRADRRTRDAEHAVVLAHGIVVPPLQRTAEQGIPGDEVPGPPESDAVGRSDSERDIRVGGLDAVETTTFAGLDYAALGHLHGRRQVTPSVGYSGSPLAFSFSERNQVKSVTLLELGPAGVRTEVLPTPVPRRLARISGDLESLLTDAALAEVEDAWLQVVLTDRRRPDAPLPRLRARFPHTLVVEFAPAGPAERGPGPVVVPRADPVEVARSFVDHVTGGPATEDEVGVLRAAHEAALAVERSA
ncbi:MAG: exonuclease SbcCD subunit D [Actinomycetota bacterium]|nr:MAG: exonuclease SbcCD subunit D [Actinomycetota bacterium]